MRISLKRKCQCIEYHLRDLLLSFLYGGSPPIFQVRWWSGFAPVFNFLESKFVTFCLES